MALRYPFRPGQAPQDRPMQRSTHPPALVGGGALVVGIAPDPTRGA
jgi:hypothetical protein